MEEIKVIQEVVTLAVVLYVSLVPYIERTGVDLLYYLTALFAVDALSEVVVADPAIEPYYISVLIFLLLISIPGVRGLVKPKSQLKRKKHHLGPQNVVFVHVVEIKELQEIWCCVEGCG